MQHSARSAQAFSWRSSYRAGACLLLLTLTNAAVARAADPDASDSKVSADDIVVTARRQSEALSKAALPVSTISGETVLAGGIITPDRLAERFPALTIQPNSTGNLVFIRGVGNFTLTPNSDPAAGWNYDGVFVARPIGTNGQLFDLERVEVLKGPQGVLYGRNASAGSINIIPRRPVANENSGYASLSVGTHDMRIAEAATNLALGDKGALRISGQLTDQDNFLSGYADGPSQQSLRIQLAVQPAPTFALRIAGDYTQLRGVGLGTSYLGNYVFDAAAGSYRFTPSGLSLSRGIYSDAAQAFRQTIFVNPAARRLDALGTKPRQAHDFYGLHAELVADVGPATLTLLPAWRRGDIDAVVSGAPFGYRQIETNEQASVEARLAGRTGPIDWLLGTLYFNEDIALRNSQNFSASHNFQIQDYATRSAALFGNVTWHVGDTFRLGAGARFTRDRKRFRGTTTTLTIVCQRRVHNVPSCPDTPLFQLAEAIGDVRFAIPSAGGAPTPLLVNGVATGAVVTRFARIDDSRLTDRAATWRLSAEADVGAGGIVYAAVETGYRPGGFNSATGFETFAPERITAYTLGARQRWMDGRLALDVELFWWDYRNQQASSVQPDLSAPPRNVNITRNIGSSRIRGGEAELVWRPSAATRLYADVQYLNAAYRRFAYIQANTGVPPLTGCDYSLDARTNLYTVDCRGQRPYNSPRWSLGFGARQDFDLGPLRLSAMARTSYRSAQTLGFTFLPEQKVGGHWTSDAQLMLADRSGRLELSAFLHNIEGKRVPNFVIFHPTSNAVVASATSPRVIGVRATTRF